MPNWCDNHLTVTSHKEDKSEAIKELKEVAAFIASDEQCLDFEKICPCPAELNTSEKAFYQDPMKKEDLDKKHKQMKKKWGYATAYDYHIGMWGTKWNACDPAISEIEGNTFDISFQTAWSPPSPLILILADRYPDIDFELKYLEFGCCFAGYTIGSGGKADDVCEGEIESPIFQELAEFFGYSEWLEEMKEQEMEDEIAENEAKEKPALIEKFAEAMTESQKEKEVENKVNVSEEALSKFRSEYMGE